MRKTVDWREERYPLLFEGGRLGFKRLREFFSH
jgi:hypothetical protein